MIPRACRVPPWALEGLADHETGSWISPERATVQASVAAGVIPSVANLGPADRLWGHAFFDFVEAEYGTEGVRRYVAAECDRQTGAAEATRAAFNLASREFDRAFLTYVREQFNDR
jgi:hypothetical protein